MNKARRKEIEKAITKLEQAHDILEQCASEEQDYFDDMPENLQTSEKAQTAEQTADALYDVVQIIEDTIQEALEATS